MAEGVIRPEVMEQLRVRRELDDRIGVLAAQIHALEAELVTTLSQHDTAQGWQSGGYRTHGQWISVRTKFTIGDSRRLASLAARIDSVPSLMADAHAGRMSIGLVSAAARVATPTNEAAVSEIVRCCTPAQAARVLASYRELRPTAGGDPIDPTDPELDLWWRDWIDDHGRQRVDAALDPTTGALLRQAREAARVAAERACAGAGLGATSRLSGDAITAALASTALEAVNTAGITNRGGERFAVQVTCDIATLAAALHLEFDSALPIGLGSRAYLCDTAHHLSNRELARIVCDADLQLLIEHDGAPLWLGNTARLFNRHQRRAMRHRSGGGGGCEFPGCTQTRWVEAHHIDEANDQGATDLPNGVLLCSYHHHELHRRGWNIVPQGTQVTFYDGKKCLGSTGPPGPAPGPPPDLGRLPLISTLPEPPAHFGPETPRSDGNGERLTRYALDVFLSNLLAA